jgi:hypothetical protein
MKYEKWELAKKNGINLANCYHFDDVTNGSICGAMATWYMPMPGNIPDMPLCAKHRKEYSKITQEEILEIIFGEISGELMEGEDEDES